MRQVDIYKVLPHKNYIGGSSRGKNLFAVILSKGDEVKWWCSLRDFGTLKK